LDERSFEFLFRHHFTGLCHFATGYVKDFSIAREIVQDAFVSLWEKRESIDPEKSVRPYLSTTVRNKCLNYLRDHRKFSTDLLSLEGFNAESEYREPDRLMEAELEKRIALSIGELPEKCREIFLLSRQDNLKYQQIADKLKISIKTVETQMSKALQHMRLRLSEYLTILLFLLIGK
jgi:RNA polymerase sigma-70 factor (ECF subfamily)